MSEYDTVIYHEMMTHPALFAHPCPEKIAILDEGGHDLISEVLKHPNITQAWHITRQKKTKQKDSRVKFISAEDTDWISKIKPDSLDVLIIAAEPAPELFNHCHMLLRHNGILILQSESPFQLSILKTTQQKLYSAGFNDIQTLHFPQPNFTSGWRAACMAIKEGTFRRPREKDIFNKPFITRYYNFDVHKAALVLPEFMREELLTKVSP